MPHYKLFPKFSSAAIFLFTSQALWISYCASFTMLKAFPTDLWLKFRTIPIVFVAIIFHSSLLRSTFWIFNLTSSLSELWTSEMSVFDIQNMTLLVRLPTWHHYSAEWHHPKRQRAELCPAAIRELGHSWGFTFTNLSQKNSLHSLALIGAQFSFGYFPNTILIFRKLIFPYWFLQVLLV